jgi:hypothetical protein
MKCPIYTSGTRPDQIALPRDALQSLSDARSLGTIHCSPLSISDKKLCHGMSTNRLCSRLTTLCRWTCGPTFPEFKIPHSLFFTQHNLFEKNSYPISTKTCKSTIRKYRKHGGELDVPVVLDSDKPVGNLCNTTKLLTHGSGASTSEGRYLPSCGAFTLTVTISTWIRETVNPWIPNSTVGVWCHWS